MAEDEAPAPEFLLATDLEVTCDPKGAITPEILCVPLLVIEVASNTVVHEQTLFVRPTAMPKLSSFCKLETGITDEDLEAAVTLPEAIAEIDAYIAENLAEKRICFITDGPWDMRQCLIPECQRKQIALADHFKAFYDVRKEFQVCFPDAEIGKATLKNIITHLDLDVEGKRHNGLPECRALAEVIRKLIEAGHTFGKPLEVAVPSSVSLLAAESGQGASPAPEAEAAAEAGNGAEAGEAAKPEASAEQDAAKTIEEEAARSVKVRGMPWQSTDAEVVKFFGGLSIVPHGIILGFDQLGRNNGEAFVTFVDVEQKQLALQRHRQHIGTRYIEVFGATPFDLGRARSKLPGSSEENGFILKLRGVPYEATTDDVVRFFKPIDLLENGVLMATDPNGHFTGEAYAQFTSAEDMAQGLQKHRQNMGERFIELFRSGMDEVQSIVDRSANAKYIQMYGAPVQTMFKVDAGRTSVVRLRGLPFRASESDVIRFFDGLSIALGGIYMSRRQDGRPTGDAFVNFDTPQGAEESLKRNRQHLKDRYIEVHRSNEMEFLRACGAAMPYQQGPPYGGYQQHGYGGGMGGYQHRPPHHNKANQMPGMGMQQQHYQGHQQSWQQQPPQQQPGPGAYHQPPAAGGAARPPMHGGQPGQGQYGYPPQQQQPGGAGQQPGYGGGAPGFGQPQSFGGGAPRPAAGMSAGYGQPQQQQYPPQQQPPPQQQQGWGPPGQQPRGYVQYRGY